MIILDVKFLNKLAIPRVSQPFKSFRSSCIGNLSKPLADSNEISLTASSSAVVMCKVEEEVSLYNLMSSIGKITFRRNRL